MISLPMFTGFYKMNSISTSNLLLKKKVSEVDHCFFQFHNTWYNKISQLLLTVFVEDWDSVFPGNLNVEIDISDNFSYNVTISYNG